MSSADVSVTEASPARRVLPFDDPSRRRRLVKVLAWLAGVAAVVLVLHLLGVDVRGWFSSVWDALTEISGKYLIVGWAVHTVQTTLTALAWYSLGQQLAVTAFNIVFATILVVWAFGWTGGKLLVRQSYDDAKVKVAEQKGQRAARKAETREADA